MLPAKKYPDDHCPWFRRGEYIKSECFCTANDKVCSENNCAIKYWFMKHHEMDCYKELHKST